MTMEQKFATADSSLKLFLAVLTPYFAGGVIPLPGQVDALMEDAAGAIRSMTSQTDEDAAVGAQNITARPNGAVNVGPRFKVSPGSQVAAVSRKAADMTVDDATILVMDDVKSKKFEDGTGTTAIPPPRHKKSNSNVASSLSSLNPQHYFVAALNTIHGTRNYLRPFTSLPDEVQTILALFKRLHTLLRNVNVLGGYTSDKRFSAALLALAATRLSCKKLVLNTVVLHRVFDLDAGDTGTALSADQVEALKTTEHGLVVQQAISRFQIRHYTALKTWGKRGNFSVIPADDAMMTRQRCHRTEEPAGTPSQKLARARDPAVAIMGWPKKSHRGVMQSTFDEY